MEKMGREQLTCEPVEGAYLEALAAAVDPAIKVQALKLPPGVARRGLLPMGIPPRNEITLSRPHAS